MPSSAAANMAGGHVGRDVTSPAATVRPREHALANSDAPTSRFQNALFNNRFKFITTLWSVDQVAEQIPVNHNVNQNSDSSKCVTFSMHLAFLFGLAATNAPISNVEINMFCLTSVPVQCVLSIVISVLYIVGFTVGPLQYVICIFFI